MSKFKRKTHFVHGFNFQGKRTSNVGEDLITVKTEETDEYPDGTPLQFDESIEDVKICPDGERPDLILYSRVTDTLTDFEWIMTDLVKDEVKPGDPATAVLFREGQIIKTRLVDIDDLSVEDEVKATGTVNTDGFEDKEDRIEDGEKQETDVSNDDVIVLDHGNIVEGSVVVENEIQSETLDESLYTVDYYAGTVTIASDATDDDDFADNDNLKVTYQYYESFGAYEKTTTDSEVIGKVLDIEREDGFVTILFK